MPRASKSRSRPLSARLRAKKEARHQAGSAIEITLILRSSRETPAPPLTAEDAVLLPPSQRRYLSHRDFEDRFGAEPKDLQRISAFAHRFGLVVIEAHRGKRVVRLRGSRSALAKAFHVRWINGRAEGRRHRTTDRKPAIPRELKDLVEGALGFDARPAAKPHFRTRRIARKGNAFSAAVVSGSAAAGLTVPQIAKLYGFPETSEGAGQCVGVIALMNATDDGRFGGGYLASDLDQYFKLLGIPAPTVVAVPVAGGDCAPGISAEADKEITLDVEVVGATAPRATIAVYFAPNTTDGFYNALLAAVHDSVNRPKIISISWGMPESLYPKSWMDQFSKVVADAAALGITICVSSGDWGSSGFSPDVDDGGANVMFPSTSPAVLTCGGTTIAVNDGAISRETAWNQGDAGGAGGGGVSSHATVPAWQQGLRPSLQSPLLTGRGVPDLAACADQTPGYQIIFQGKPLVMGGTSAVAPLMAGFLARVNAVRTAAALPSLGCVTAQLYQNAALRSAFRGVVEGDNDIRGNLKLYQAGTGWNACGGLGAPDGAALAAALEKI